MSDHPDTVVVVQRKLTVTWYMKLSEVYGANAIIEDAIEYEKNLPRQEAIRSIIEGAELLDDSDVQVEVYVTWKLPE